ncbi:MAG: OOP family OmpA-OmpF porin, partial [Flavobacteriales bacterium]
MLTTNMFRIIILFFFISSSILGQGYGPNTVINPSFEEVVACPFQLGQIAFASPWGSYGVTADLYSTCAGANCPNFTAPYVCVPTNTYGSENPIRGNNYAGCFFAKDGDIGRSYLVSQLRWPLVKGKTYRVKLFVSLAEESNVAIDQIGAFFSENRVEAGPSTQIYAEPQVRSDSIINQQNGWTEIQNEFIAEGNERFLTIGAFISATSTQYEVVNDTSGGIMSYYYIDSVSVQQYYPPQPGGPPNQSVCEGESITLSA